jgi:hypothetical protein
MHDRDLPAREVRGEEQFPQDEAELRHPRKEGKGGLEDDIGDSAEGLDRDA